MAVVVMPLMSVEARGSVGGLTYNTNRGVRYVKTRSGPSREPTAKQLQMLGLNHNCNSIWAAMTIDQRRSWDDYADTHTESDWTGTPRRKSGQNWFSRINVRRQLLSLPIEEAPPTETQQGHLDGFTVFHIPDVVACEWSHSTFPQHTYTWLELYLAGPLSAGINATLHNAIRADACPIDDESIAIHAYGLGTFTLFSRLMLANGIVGPWRRDLVPDVP